jgi:hypothetical protein
LEKARQAKASLAAAQPAQTPPKAEITIVNNTGYDVKKVELTTSGSTTTTTWTQGAFRKGESDTFRDLELTRYDITMTDTDGDTYTKRDVQIADKARIVFTMDDYNKKTAVASASPSGSSSSSGSSGSAPGSSIPGYSTSGNITTSRCAVCSGTGRISGLNPNYGQAAADAIRYGWRNTTPMYTDQVCYLCKGSGVFVSTYIDPKTLPGSSGGGGGSSSSSGYSGSRTPSQCSGCYGPGQIYASVPDYTYGSTTVQTYCEICRATYGKHGHKPCPSCGGSGYR